MKILFILELYKPHIGGVETLFSNLIDNLVKDGHQITILTSRFKSDLPDYEKLDNGVEIFRVGYNRYDFMLYSILPGLKLAKNCDIIHTTTYNAAIPANIIAKITGKKIVLTVHEIFGKLWYKFMGFKGFFYKIFERVIFLFNFDKYICVSNYTKNCLRVYSGIDDNKLITVYNGIDYDLRNNDNVSQDNIKYIKEKYKLDGYFTGFFWGRPGVSKGLEYYIEAIPHIRKLIPNFKAFLVIPRFDKSRVSYIESLISKLDPDSYVINNEFVPDEETPTYTSVCDFVIVPSRAEGFGFNVATTCALGKPIITTNIGSIPEVAFGKVVFIEPSNVQSIIDAVVRIYNNDYQVIEEKKFFWKTNSQMTNYIYNEVLGK